MAGNEDLKVHLVGDVSGLRRSLRRATGMVNRFAQRAGRAIGGFTKGIAGAVGKLAGIGGALVGGSLLAGFGFLVKSSIEYADNIGKAADRTGIFTESLQELQYAAQIAGVEQGQLEKGLIRLNQAASQARAGMATYKRAFDQAGVSLYDHNGAVKDTERLFMDLAEATGNMGDRVRATDILMQTFGRAGARLAPLFKNGAEGVKQLRQEARELGLVLDNAMVRQAEQANDELTRLGNVVRVQVTKAILELTPEIIELAKSFTEWLVPAFRSFFAWLSPTRFLPLRELENRMQEFEQQIERLAGMKFEDVLKLPTLEGLENGDKIKKLLKQIIEYDDALKRRTRTMALYAAGSKKGADADNEFVAAVRDVKAELEFELAQLGRTKAEQRLYSLAKAKGVEVNDAFRKSVKPLIDDIEREEAAAEAAKKALKDLADAEKAAADARQEVFDRTRTPLEKYNIEVQRLKDLLDETGADQELYARAVKMAKEEMESATETSNEWSNALENVTVQIGDAFADAIIGGKGLREIFSGLAEDITRMIIKLVVLQKMKGILKGLGEGAEGIFGPGAASDTGGYQFLTGLFSAGASAAGGGGGIGAAAAQLIGGIAVEARKGAAFDSGTRFLARGGVLIRPDSARGTPTRVLARGGVLDGSASGTPPLRGPRLLARGGMLQSALGGAGGILESPTLFSSKGGLAIAGEAGKEGVLPLGRDGQGNLGVKIAEEVRQGPSYAFHFHGVRDFDSFERNQDQTAGNIFRAMQMATTRNRTT